MPPIVIAGAIAGAASIGGAVLSSSSSKKAATQAAAAQTDNTAANNALQRELYGYNTANFSPYMATGNAAMGQINGLLGLNTQQPQAAYQPAGGQNALYGTSGFQTPRNLGEGNYLGDPGMVGPTGLSGGQQFVPGPVQNGVTAPAPSAGDAWDNFRNSTNYQFRLGEGMNALNQGYAGIGALNSGAAVKDSIRYGQNFASNELNNYIGLLQGQQNLGFGGAQALAGVSNNYGNNVTANNNNAADALSNAALLRGQANNSLYGGIASGLGSFASSFGGKGW